MTLADVLWGMSDGRVGRVITDGVVWFVEGVTGGVMTMLETGC